MGRRRRRRRHNKKKYQMFDRSGRTNDVPLAPKQLSTRSYWAGEVCDHWRTPFRLAVGTVHASAWRDRHTDLAGNTKVVPQLGFYMDDSWQENAIVVTPGVNIPFARRTLYPRILYPWADYGVPENVQRITDAVVWLHDEIARGKAIDIGCLGGHGRTGTVLAMLLVVEGMGAWDAINCVRQAYCDEAIETPGQVELVRKMENLLAGRALDDGLDSPDKPRTWGVFSSATGTSYGKTEPVGSCRKCQREVFWPDIHVASHRNEAFDPETDIEYYKTTDDEVDAELVDEEEEAFLAYLNSPDEGQKQNLVEHYKRGNRRNRDSEAATYLSCVEPPCPFPHECDIIEGDCWKYRIGVGSGGDK